MDFEKNRREKWNFSSCAGRLSSLSFSFNFPSIWNPQLHEHSNEPCVLVQLNLQSWRVWHSSISTHFPFLKSLVPLISFTQNHQNHLFRVLMRQYTLLFTLYSKPGSHLQSKVPFLSSQTLLSLHGLISETWFVQEVHITLFKLI